MQEHILGTQESSEQLLKDLYIDLRNKVNEWAKVTQQTPQARMGYIGQHLVSVVTGYPGGKSGARGYDLVMGNGEYGEIKTCYRVDQLGKCIDCTRAVSSLEKECSYCGSKNILRKDDSKWLIGIRHDDEFKRILEPKRYYFVLFEMQDIKDVNNSNIVVSIWEVKSENKGFAYWMMDYYLNERPESEAPCDVWPYHIKFALTQPELIYRSIITGEGEIETQIFPDKGNCRVDELRPLTEYSRAKTLTEDVLKEVAEKFLPEKQIGNLNKKELLNLLEEARGEDGISNVRLCDAFADAIYLPRLKPVKTKLPKELSKNYIELQ